MALSGSQYELFHNSCHKLIVEWSASQNVGGNYSTVTANLYVQGTQGWSTIYSGSVVKSVSLVINGNRKNGTARIDINGTEKRLLLSHTVNVPHNADGSKSFRIEGMWKPQITWSGTYYGSEEWTRQDWSLNAIPRASTFNQSATTFNMDGEGTIYINPASSSFTHKLYMHFGNRRVLLKDNPPTRQNFTVRFSASDFASQIPNATSGVGTLTLETYNGGSLVGSSSRQTYLNLPSNYIPSQPSVTVSDESSVPAKLGVSKTAGIYVKGMSLLRFSCSASGVLGSTITGYQVKIGSQTFSSASGTIDIDLSKFDVGTGSLNAVVTVTDSRGRTNSRTVGINIQNYSAPKINNFSAVRQNNSANIIITKPVSVSSILNGSTNINSYTVKTEYKLSSASTWTNWRNETNASAVINSGGWDVTKSYDIRVTLADKLNQMVVTASISTAKTLISYHKDVGVGIGKMHERGALDVGGDSYFGGKVQFNGGIEYVIIPDNADLNDYRTVGFYRIPYDGNGTVGGSSIKNSPIKTCFSLKVEQTRGMGSSGDVFFRQILISPYDNRILTRRYAAGTWTSWVEIVDSSTFNNFFDSRYEEKIVAEDKGNISLGYGLHGRVIKRGNTVTISVWRQVINWQGSGEFKLLDETMPSDIIPAHEVNLILTKNAGSTNPPPMTIHIQKDGHMYFTNFNPGTWVHCGTVTYQLI